MISCIITSGGSGERFGFNEENLPKQYVKINNERILKTTITKFEKEVDYLVCAIRAEDENFFIKELSGYKYCIGRSSRQESV